MIMRYMNWSRLDLDCAWPEDIEAIKQIAEEESNRPKAPAAGRL